MKNKSYYGALCACLGLLVIGAGVSLYGINQQTKPKPPEVTPQTIQQTPAERVSIQNVPTLEDSMAQREATTQNGAEAPKTEPKQTKTPVKPQANAKSQETTTAFSEETDSAQTGVFHSDPLFQSPLQGEIVMDYSNDHAIYDVTLDQYRTNDYVSISAEKGEKVKASEDGTVESITTDEQRGKTIVIHHNNGWSTTYSQLENDVCVAKGDKVQKGQEIGTVAEPTKYGILLGTHLDFAVSKDGAYVDPKSALAE